MSGVVIVGDGVSGEIIWVRGGVKGEHSSENTKHPFRRRTLIAAVLHWHPDVTACPPVLWGKFSVVWTTQSLIVCDRSLRISYDEVQSINGVLAVVGLFSWGGKHCVIVLSAFSRGSSFDLKDFKERDRRKRSKVARVNDSRNNREMSSYQHE